MDQESKEADKIETNSESIPGCFKKPILIGKIGKFPRKLITKTNVLVQDKSVDEEKPSDDEKITTDDSLLGEEELKGEVLKSSDEKAGEKVLDYVEPGWSGIPISGGDEYTFEVLKSGVIIDRINLMSKSCWVFGRAAKTDIYMAHPTISRFHAVLQYRKVGTEKEPPGFYIYDLNSTYGTFLNKGRLKTRCYAPVKVGHMLKLGCSTRSYILAGPEDELEEESKFTVTELRQQKAEKIIQKELAEKEALIKSEKEKEDKIKRDEERGVDWGLGDDADEETDLRENPFAQTNNEELYIDDPKKALRGFMEREGHSLDYDCSEQGFGQFLCKVELPLDDDVGRPIVAEVLHKGKKKEAVVQCALEACKILDRYGVLRQAMHESRKRKAKNWEENDFYDSDDDTFLDRTGTIEKKREKRMQSKVPTQPETYQSLLDKERSIAQRVRQLEKQLHSAKHPVSGKSSNEEEDPLDSFMSQLKQSKPDKQAISKIKTELVGLKIERINVVKLINLVKPTDLPPLVIEDINLDEQPSSSGTKPKSLPLFGKRRKVKVQLPSKPVDEKEVGDEEEENEDVDNEASKNKDKVESLPIANTADEESDKQLTAEEIDKRKKKNQKRRNRRRDQSEFEQQKGYDEDEDYVWVPPNNQTGDGRTSLNEKYGY